MDINILFIDDEVPILTALKREFSNGPFNVHLAHTGLLALHVMEKHPIEIVVADLDMPRMNGIELMHYIDEGYPDCLKVVLSGKAGIEDIATLINQVHIDAFMQKPWKKKELIEKVVHLVKKKRHDVNQHNLLHQQLRSMQAQTGIDELTGTVSKTKLIEYTIAQIESFRRYKQPFCLSVFEVDDYNELERQMTSKELATLLQEIARIVSTRIRILDMLSRSGNARFSLILSHTNEKQALILITELAETLNNHIFKIGRKINFHFAIVEFNDFFLTVEKLLEQANQQLQMYPLKSNIISNLPS